MERSLRRSALIASAVYVVLGTLWILLSDLLAGFIDPTGSAAIQTVKGFLFVVVTGALFYVIASRWASHVLALEGEVACATEDSVHAHQLLSSVFQVAPQAVIVFDRDGIVRMWSPGATTILGWKQDEVVSHHFPTMAQENEETGTILARPLSGETITGVDAVMRRRDGVLLDVSIAAAPILDAEGTAVEAVCFIEDITQRKERERELEAYRTTLEELVAGRTRALSEANEQLELANQAKSRFLAAMSHEFRTPLNSIIGFTYLLGSGVPGELNEEQARQVDIVNSAAANLLELINGILDLSKIEAGRESMRLSEVTVAETVQSVMAMLAPLATEANLEMSWHVEDPSMRVITDKGKVRQILMNLIGNAIKFTKAGRVDLSVTSDGAMVRCVVTDTGPGIHADELALVTEDFYRAENPDPSRSPGTGLGLSISKRLAEMLGGRIEVESILGEGSTFTLVMPVHSVAEDQAYDRH